jgi:hypothetical protein
VIDADSGAILDASLGHHGYQLWTAAVGTLIEAQSRGQRRAVLGVHQFAPRDLTAVMLVGDTRDRAAALAANADAFEVFPEQLKLAGATSHETDFVEPGIRLELLKVQSVLVN